MKIKHTRKDLGLISEDPDTGSEHRGHHEERSPHSTCCGSSELWMLIQLFLSFVITLDERIWTFSFVCRFHADLHKVKSVLRDPEHALCGESERLCPNGAGSDLWLTKPTEEETLVPSAVRRLNRARSSL